MSDALHGHDADFTFDFARDQSPEQLRNMVRERIPRSDRLATALFGTQTAASLSLNPRLEANLYRSIVQSVRPYQWNEALGLWVDYSDDALRPILELTDSITEQINESTEQEISAQEFWGGTQEERRGMQEGREAVRQLTPDLPLRPVEDEEAPAE